MRTSSVRVPELKQEFRDLIPHLGQPVYGLFDAFMDLSYEYGRTKGLEDAKEIVGTGPNALGAHASDADRRDFDARR